MPKYGIHYIVLDEMSKKLATSSSNAEKAIANSIENNRAAANLGAIGPDLLFWAPDFDIVQGIRNFIEPFKILKNTINSIEDVVEGISEGFENIVNVPKNFVLDQLKNSSIPFISTTANSVADLDQFMVIAKQNLGENIDSIQSELLPAICLKGLGMDAGLETFTLARSIFQGQFGSGNQIGKEEQDWYWFDMLHYRNTGDFARKLIENAEASNNDELKAYAYGYVTHYVTDTVGHPFVNTISGSPFRIAAQRHAVIENYMDQYEWHSRYKNNIRNEMYKGFKFDSYDISDELAELISSTIKDTYGAANSARPRRYKNNDGFLSKADIKVAFELQKLALEFLGGSEAVLKPVEPKPGFDEILSDFFDDIDFPSPPPIPGNSGDESSLENLSDQIEVWFQAIENWAKWALEVVKELVDTIVDTVIAAGNLIVEAVTFTIELLTYAIQCLMYNIYRTIHQILVLSGLAYPEPDDVDLNNPIAKDHITTHKASVNNKEEFPVLKFPGQQHLDRKSYLDIIKTGDRFPLYNFGRRGRNPNPLKFKDFEEPFTKNSFYARNVYTTPNVFIDDRINSPLDLNVFRKFADAQTPEETRALYGTLNRGFGNAVDLSIHILSNKNNHAHDVFCNWNLDGDRGYGYKTWDGIPFTCTNSENGGLIRASIVKKDNDFEIYAEPDEYTLQNPQTWTVMKEDGETTKIQNEVYVKNKLKGQGFLSPITVSEKNIPDKFTDPRKYMNTNLVTDSDWEALLPERYSLVDTKINSDNFFFVNGIDTTPSAGQRATMALQKTLNTACSKELKISKKKIKINYFHNYSDLIWGDLSTVSDVIEVIFSDYLYIYDFYNNIGNPAKLLDIKITNPAQVAVMALLHKGMLENKKLMISGHSQGSMITSSAVLAFWNISLRHKKYLMGSVKVFHMEPEVLKPIRSKIREILNDTAENEKYLVYIMNSGDRPLGSDILTDYFAQDFPLAPSGMLNVENEIKNLKRLFEDMQQNINAGNILRIGETLSAGSTELKNIFSKFINSDFRYLTSQNSDSILDAHQISNQLRIISDDIINNNFRSDPKDGAHISLSRSNNSPVHPSSINVKSFILT